MGFFQTGNKYAQEWTLENSLPRFEDALKDAEENEDCLCIQDAISVTGIPSRTFYYLAENHSVLQTIKQDIMSQIIRRINRNSLDKNMPSPAAPSIWRMKQLGEKDQQYMESKITETSKQTITVQDKETAKLIDDLIKDFDSE